MVELNLLHKDLTDLIIQAFYKVYNELGYGFLEKVYENALIIELKKIGLLIEQQVKIKVYYDETPVGFYLADLLVESSVIVEIKAAESLCYEHECQLINYLKASNVEVGLLLNFGKKPTFKRKVFSKK
ncbi:MAG TPA: GxxExxY protein [Chitinophagales bacterium]|nr:GxxExxY protein [Chitinophagales bacterium]HRG28314.1 GxxExxY protein [Chitinophagales bacterium]HRG86360.1 GxxExxY protein [Chitinophagales bacterium]HRH54829.1 GxxExxY protein [Chitinophagales bacterium]